MTALELLRSFRPYLVLTDVQLPGMDGLELTRRLKQDEKTRGIAVIALPLSVLSLLIATSHYYDPSQVWPMLIGLLGICTALTLLGGFLVLRATMHIHSYDRKVGAIKARYRQIAPLVE